MTEDSSEDFFVDKLVGIKLDDSDDSWLVEVKWKDHSACNNAWEPFENALPGSCNLLMKCMKKSKMRNCQELSANKAAMEFIATEDEKTATEKQKKSISNKETSKGAVNKKLAIDDKSMEICNHCSKSIK